MRQQIAIAALTSCAGGQAGATEECRAIDEINDSALTFD